MNDTFIIFQRLKKNPDWVFQKGAVNSGSSGYLNGVLLLPFSIKKHYKFLFIKYPKNKKE